MASPPGTGSGMVAAAATHREEALSSNSCSECRRRKSRCNRTIPQCELCQRFGRRCVYERVARTPLTRRYLSEVEQELERTRALLREARSMSQGRSAVTTGAGEQQHQQREPQGEQQDEPQDQSGEGSTAAGEVPVPRPRQVILEDGRPYQSSLEAPSSQPQRTPAFSLETPPSSGDFEWDERNGVASGEKFVDGMGSLGGESGYLGVASGAALLRITDPKSLKTLEMAEAFQNQNTADGSSRPRQSIPFALTSLSQLEPFIDAYFRLYHQSYPIVYEAMFRAQFMEVVPRPAGNSWQVLLFSIAAIGAFSASTEPTEADIGLFDAARARLSIDMLETGNLILVQALTLISNYLQKRNKPNSGYNYTGLARRIAMGIGLHKEYPNWDASPLTLEMRRRAWYCLYIFDVGAIITFSRPLDFPDGGIDVELPLNVHDSDITAATKVKPPPANETTLYTHLRSQATLHLATCQIYPRIISASLPSAKELIELDDLLIGNWLSSLPPYFQENVIQAPKFTLCHSILRWRYRNFRILMYRPFLVRRLMSRPADRQGETDIEPQDDIHTIEIAIKRCLDCAEESVDLISQFWATDQQTMLACWYGLYFLFQAVLIPVICLRNDPQSHLSSKWRDQILKAIRVIESMVLLNPTAKRCLEVIQSLCGAYLVSSTEGWGSPTQESPQTQLASLYPLMWPTLESAQFEGVDSIMQESTILDFMNQISGFE